MLMILDRRDLTIRHKDGVIRVYKGDELVQRAGVNLLEMLVIYGNPLVESAVWRVLASKGVPAIILPTRGRQPPAILAEGLATQLPTRRLQYRLAENKPHAVSLTRWLLTRKFLSYHLPHSVLAPHLDTEINDAFTKHIAGQIQQLHNTDSIEVMIGIEGQMSREWFQLLAAQLPKKWKFTGRNRQPPQDPLNALLSLSYTIVMADIRQMLVSEGFDPAFGFLHQAYPARESLTLDLLEIFRSGIDLFAINLLAIMTPQHFSYSEQDGCRLNKEARQIFYREWAMYRKNWPRPLQKTPDYKSAYLREIARGQIRELKQIMQLIDDASSKEELDN